MKKLTICMILFPVLLLGGNLQAQQLVSPSGNTVSNNTAEISWALGEIAIQTESNSSNIITSGMHQDLLVVTLIDEFAENKINISAYPNPVKDFMAIEVENPQDASLSYQIFDISGRLVMNGEIIEPKTVLSFTSYKSDSYILKIIQNNKEIKVFKIVKP